MGLGVTGMGAGGLGQIGRQTVGFLCERPPPVDLLAVGGRLRDKWQRE